MIVRQANRNTKLRIGGGRTPRDRQYRTFRVVDAPIQPGNLRHDHILTPEQLAASLKVEVSWIYEQTRKRARRRNADPLPSIRLGKYLRFYWPEVERWLERRQEGQANA